MNFSSSSIWNKSLCLRYPVDKIKRFGNVFFYENNSDLICQTFFEPNITYKDLEYLKGEVEDSKRIRFSYINNSKVLDSIKKWALDNNYFYEVIDCWEAPQLVLNNNIDDYLNNK